MYVHSDVYVDVYVSVYVCVSVCVSACVSVYVYVYVHTHIMKLEYNIAACTICTVHSHKCVHNNVYTYV